jgi:hypothetical protein
MRRALLLGVISLLAGGCTWFKDRDTVRSVITEARPRLDARRTALGPVEIHGAEIDLLGGRLRLVVRLPDENEAADRTSVHVHVLAIPKDRATGRLDLCIVGADFAEAARALTEHALPPLISAVRQQPVLGASHAWSDASHGIPGHSAYFGRYYVRGDADGPAISNLLDAGILADLPELPGDGRMHLLKVVVEATAGDWMRTLELDGDIKLETARPLKTPSSAPAMVVAFVVLDGEPDPRNDTTARREAHQRLAAHPESLPDPHECPAKIMPAKFVNRDTWDDTAARGGRLLYAVRACESGDREHCYAAAQELIVEDPKSPAAQSLFLAACHLGDASGCTNAAASHAQDDCSFATYEASCDRGQDPWGCTMLGYALVEGDLRHRDLQRARTVLPKACRVGQDAPACQTARQLLESLDDMPPAGPGEAPRTGW